MRGPPDTPYEDGVFELYCEFGPEYPVKPPLVRFVTPVSFSLCGPHVWDIHTRSGWTNRSILSLLSADTDGWQRHSSSLKTLHFYYSPLTSVIYKGLPLQCEQCGKNLSQRIWSKLLGPHYHERDPGCHIWAPDRSWTRGSSWQVNIYIGSDRVTEILKQQLFRFVIK